MVCGKVNEIELCELLWCKSLDVIDFLFVFITCKLVCIVFCMCYGGKEFVWCC